jgi:hypothetical protein
MVRDLHSNYFRGLAIRNSIKIEQRCVRPCDGKHFSLVFLSNED